MKKMRAIFEIYLLSVAYLTTIAWILMLYDEHSKRLQKCIPNTSMTRNMYPRRAVVNVSHVQQMDPFDRVSLSCNVLRFRIPKL